MEFFLHFLRDKYLIHSKLWGRYSSSFRWLWIGLLSFVFRFLYLNFNFSRGKTKKSDCWVIWKVYVELYKKLYWKTVFHCGYHFVFSPAKYECFSCPFVSMVSNISYVSHFNRDTAVSHCHFNLHLSHSQGLVVPHKAKSRVQGELWRTRGEQTGESIRTSGL